MWTNFKQHLNSSTLLRDLLLDDPRPPIRKNAMKQVLSKCAFSPKYVSSHNNGMAANNFALSLAQVSITDFTVAFWPMVATLIPYAAKQLQSCEEVFTLSNQLFKKLADTSTDFFNLDELISQWSTLLLSHTPNEVYLSFPGLAIELTVFQSVGYPESPDTVALGLAQLLFSVTSFSKASQQPLSSR